MKFQEINYSFIIVIILSLNHIKLLSKLLELSIDLEVSLEFLSITRGTKQRGDSFVCEGRQEGSGLAVRLVTGRD